MGDKTICDAPVWAWWAGRDEEWFSYGGPLPTREDAIAEGRASADGEGFFVIEARQYVIRFSAQRLIEDQYVENEDLFDGEHGDPDRMAGATAADEELQALLDDWLARHRSTFATPNLFAAQRNLEWIEPEADEPGDSTQ